MVGYADPCPHCGNNKRRRFDRGNHSRSAEISCLHLTPPPSPPQRKAASYPMTAAAKNASPSRCQALLATVTPPIAADTLARRTTPEPDSSEGSCPSLAASQFGSPVNVSPVRSPPSVHGVGLQETVNGRRHENIKKDVKEEEREAPTTRREEEKEAPTTRREEETEVAATMCVKCKCGRKQEFLYRQKKP